MFIFNIYLIDLVRLFRNKRELITILLRSEFSIRELQEIRDRVSGPTLQEPACRILTARFTKEAATTPKDRNQAQLELENPEDMIYIRN